MFVEKHIFRGYVISIEDVLRARTTEDVIRNIQGELNSQDEFCQKMGEMFWDRNDEFMKMPPLQIHSVKWLTSPSVLQAHHQSSPRHHTYHKKFHDQESIIHLRRLHRNMCEMNCKAMNIVGIAQRFLQCPTKKILMNFCPTTLVDIKYLPPIKRLLPL